MEPYFKRSDFACKCGECNNSAVDYELLDVIIDMRKSLGFPMIINSGNRCPAHNEAVGGAKRSMHLASMAADIRPTWSNKDFNGALNAMHEYLLSKYPDKYGIAISEGSFVHIDVKPGVARRWKY